MTEEQLAQIADRASDLDAFLSGYEYACGSYDKDDDPTEAAEGLIEMITNRNPWINDDLPRVTCPRCGGLGHLNDGVVIYTSTVQSIMGRGPAHIEQRPPTRCPVCGGVGVLDTKRAERGE